MFSNNEDAILVALLDINYFSDIQLLYVYNE